MPASSSQLTYPQVSKVPLEQNRHTVAFLHDAEPTGADLCDTFSFELRLLLMHINIKSCCRSPSTSPCIAAVVVCDVLFYPNLVLCFQRYVDNDSAPSQSFWSFCLVNVKSNDLSSNNLWCNSSRTSGFSWRDTATVRTAVYSVILPNLQ